MSTPLKPYPSYKDSGVEWLGRIPAQWSVSKLGTNCSVKARLGWKGLKASEYVNSGYIFLSTPNIKSWAIDFDDVNYITAERYFESPEIKLQEGDVLIAKDGSTLGTCNVVRNLPAPGTVNSSIAVIRPKSAFDSLFLWRFLSGDYTQNVIQRMKGGMGVPHLFQADLRKFIVLRPPLDEQQAIAEFLDRETGKIDALVKKKEQLIELLREKRTALISHAVTQGLNPSVPKKDSGIPWLGRIPEHWECVSVKRRTTRIQTGTTPPTSEQRYYENGSIDWFGPGSFTSDLPLTEPVKRLAASAVTEGAARLFKAGSTMIVTIGATIGKVGYLENDGSSNQQITALTFDKKRIVSKFAAYQLKRLEPVLRGIAPTTTLPILDQSEIGYLPLAVPPSLEQQAIVDRLEQETAKLDTLTAKVRTAIERLQEYRTALISAAVTGQIDVRNC